MTVVIQKQVKAKLKHAIVSFRFPIDLVEEIQKIAKKAGISRNALVVEMLKQSLKDIRIKE
jgi:predicted HicB family RNase H-like nuclease